MSLGGKVDSIFLYIVDLSPEIGSRISSLVSCLLQHGVRLLDATVAISRIWLGKDRYSIGQGRPAYENALQGETELDDLAGSLSGFWIIPQKKL